MSYFPRQSPARRSGKEIQGGSKFPDDGMQTMQTAIFGAWSLAADPASKVLCNWQLLCAWREPNQNRHSSDPNISCPSYSNSCWQTIFRQCLFLFLLKSSHTNQNENKTFDFRGHIIQPLRPTRQNASPVPLAPSTFRTLNCQGQHQTISTLQHRAIHSRARLQGRQSYEIQLPRSSSR